MRNKIAETFEFMIFPFGLFLSIGAALFIVFIILSLVFDIVNGDDPAFGSQFDLRNVFVQQCLESEQYTREECLYLTRPEGSK